MLGKLCGSRSLETLGEVLGLKAGAPGRQAGSVPPSTRSQPESSPLPPCVEPPGTCALKVALTSGDRCWLFQAGQKGIGTLQGFSGRASSCAGPVSTSPPGGQRGYLQGGWVQELNQVTPHLGIEPGTYRTPCPVPVTTPGPLL